MKGEPQCLDCRHDLPLNEAWDYFKDSMNKWYGAVISDKHKHTQQAIRHKNFLVFVFGS
jgi:hypothetical protein